MVLLVHTLIHQLDVTPQFALYVIEIEYLCIYDIGVSKHSSHVLIERLTSEISTDQLDLANVLREANKQY